MTFSHFYMSAFYPPVPAAVLLPVSFRIKTVLSKQAAYPRKEMCNFESPRGGANTTDLAQICNCRFVNGRGWFWGGSGGVGKRRPLAAAKTIRKKFAASARKGSGAAAIQAFLINQWTELGAPHVELDIGAFAGPLRCA